MNKDDQFAWQRNGDEYTRESIVNEKLEDKIDTLEDALFEMLGNDVSRKTIVAFARWHQTEMMNSVMQREQLVKALPWFIAWALDDQNPSLKLWATAFALGMEITEGVSQSRKADQLHVTRAAISKRVAELRKEYGFESRNMKSAEARKAYSNDKKTNHHRYKIQIENAKNEFNNNATD